MAAPRHRIRIDHNGTESQSGRLFVCPSSGDISDLSAVRLLGCSVDTVRQLYRGSLRADVLALFLGQPAGLVTWAGERWHAGRVGRDSGYQYKLQNADAGLVLLLKNYNTPSDQVGAHLKIECSPHLIASHSPAALQALLDDLAWLCLEEPEHNSCAVHMALDVQGWTPPADLVARMHCKSRKVREHSGIQSIDWAATSSTYGAGESWLWGSAGGVQCSIYDKTTQARVVDKLDYWRERWSRADNPFDPADPANFDRSLPVWRVELRFHHSVVQQFADGSTNFQTGELIEVSHYGALAAHLDALWRYGLQSFRLLDRPGLYAGFWSLIMQDVTVDAGTLSLVGHYRYKRAYKTASGFTGKNVDLFLGNFVSLLARERVGAKKAMRHLKGWACWGVILEHFQNKGQTEQDVYRWLCDKLAERHIRWGKAQ